MQLITLREIGQVGVITLVALGSVLLSFSLITLGLSLLGVVGFGL